MKIYYVVMTRFIIIIMLCGDDIGTSTITSVGSRDYFTLSYFFYTVRYGTGTVLIGLGLLKFDYHINRAYVLRYGTVQ